MQQKVPSVAENAGGHPQILSPSDGGSGMKRDCETVETSVVTLRSELDSLRGEIGVTPCVMQLEELLARLAEEIGDQ